MNALTTSETLNKAADCLEKRGWGQGPHGWGSDTEGSRLCLEGALLAALDLDWVTVNLGEFAECPAYRAVADYLDYHAAPLYDWNDNLDRTAEQVIATLRAAALIEAAKETAADPLVAHLAHHAVDIIAAELDTTAAPL